MKAKMPAKTFFSEAEKKTGRFRVAHFNPHAESATLKDLQEKARQLQRNYSFGGYQGL